MIDHTPRLRTLGILARDVGIPPDRADRLIRRHGIEPIARCGIVRLFDTEACRRLRYLANVQDAREAERIERRAAR